MARPTAPINLSPGQNELLQSIVRSREVPHSLVQRAQIVLDVLNGSDIGEGGTIKDGLICGYLPWMHGLRLRIPHQSRPLNHQIPFPRRVCCSPNCLSPVAVRPARIQL